MSMKNPFFSIVVTFFFLANSIGFAPISYANPMGEIVLPAPGTMVHVSQAFTPAHLKGMTVHPENALQFDFIMDKGEEELIDIRKNEEYSKIIKYFLTSLTVSDKDQWVNLSPYESDRIIENNFGRTEMGRDLLAQDYLLKQITSSLMYPESKLGKSFWDNVYERAFKEFGNTNIPVKTINKVWIMPDEAIVYESNNSVIILKNHLKVMLEEDYLALQKKEIKQDATRALSNDVVRQIIIPALEKEINEGKNFAPLRQIVSAMILATWYKQTLKESLLGKVYTDQSRIKGVDQDPKFNNVIYQQYLAAFKKGVYSYIKEDEDKYTKQIMPRKYFAGGFKWDRAMSPRLKTVRTGDELARLLSSEDLAHIKRERVRFVQAGVLLSPSFPQTGLESVQPGNIDKFDPQITMPSSLEPLKNVNAKYSYYHTERINHPVMVATYADLIKDYYNNSKPDKRNKMGMVVGWMDLKNASIYRQKPKNKEMFISGEAIPVAISLDEDRILRVQPRHQDDFVYLNFGVRINNAIEWYYKDPYLQDLYTSINAKFRHDAGKIDLDLNIPKYNSFYDKFKSFVAQLFGRSSIEEEYSDSGIFDDNQIPSLSDEDASFLWAGVRESVEISVERKADQAMSVADAKRLLSNPDEYREFLSKLSEEEIERLGKVQGLELLAKAIREHSIALEAREAIKEADNLLDRIRHGKLTETSTDNSNLGGINLNAEHLNLNIKRDGKGIVLPFSKQDINVLNKIEGFIPRIIEIKPAMHLPILSEIEKKFELMSEASHSS